MFKRAAAEATGRSPAVSRTPLSGSGEERTARKVEGVARGRLPVERVGLGFLVYAKPSVEITSRC